MLQPIIQRKALQSLDAAARNGECSETRGAQVKDVLGCHVQSFIRVMMS